MKSETLYSATLVNSLVSKTIPFCNRMVSTWHTTFTNKCLVTRFK